MVDISTKSGNQKALFLNQKLKRIKTSMIKILIIPIKNKNSATDSTFFSLSSLEVLIEIKDRILEMVKNKATIAVNSSMSVRSVFSATCNEVINNRQNPIRLVQVPKICGDVLFAINKFK